MLEQLQELINDIVLLPPPSTTLITPAARGLVSPRLRLCRHVERHHQGGHKDAENGHHVARGLPPRGPDHEEAPTRQAGAPLRRGV